MKHEAKSSDKSTREESPSQLKTEPTCIPESSQPRRQPNVGVRKDKRHLHVMRHAVLSQFPLQALARLGENARRLRRLERALKAELKPAGILENMLFDRLWSCYLRCLLASRMEAFTLFPTKGGKDKSTQIPTNLVEGEQPILIWETYENANGNFPPDLFQQLSLVQRYDAHFSREMLRYLGLLSLLKKRGEVGLEGCIEKMLGPKPDQ